MFTVEDEGKGIVKGETKGGKEGDMGAKRGRERRGEEEQREVCARWPAGQAVCSRGSCREGRAGSGQHLALSPMK